jgi:DsbC/DsbD-like thiol-disulfide interchange protein
VIKLIKIKKVMKSALFFMGSLILLGGFTSAQEDVVGVETFVSKKGVHAGETFKVALMIQVSPGWHIHAHELLDDFLIPTDFTIDEIENISILDYYYPAPISEKFEYSDNEIQIYDGDVLVGALVKTEKDIPPGAYKMEGRFQYQACDDSSCVAPKTIDLEIFFKVVPSEEESKKVHEEIFSQIKFEK